MSCCGNTLKPQKEDLELFICRVCKRLTSFEFAAVEVEHVLERTKEWTCMECYLIRKIR